MEIKSKLVRVQAPIQEVFDFLKDTRNIYELLPQDKISDWQADELSCSFKVQGGIIIPFKQVALEEPEKIHLESGDKAPFPFKLTIFLSDQGSETEGYLRFDGQVNMFLKMMIEGPLEHLFNLMAQNLRKRYEQDSSV
ncbi:MAG: hypothetical protein EP338_08340 [Bacteroidetes bacterium]|nr:MAG: hypothetical protein EP338_08340 [Bacteroidota bacterium]